MTYRMIYDVLFDLFITRYLAIMLYLISPKANKFAMSGQLAELQHINYKFE
ncbi:hypothetical protein PCURB6_23360 [Paenibacillus curdlanolyticus]|nr:hypothetical protein PCURB6_23360 [Paenibacillus curdlanolyticus]